LSCTLDRRSDGPPARLCSLNPTARGRTALSHPRAVLCEGGCHG
jgi:hypothetical protein